ncbi:hypothetical protein ACFQ0T_14120 [Kitasatospora gansuensis]
MSGWTEEGEARPQPVGDALDALGITAALGPDELLVGAVVLLKVLQPDGAVRLSLTHSDGLGWIERAGMLHLAEHIETTSALAGD